MSEHQSTSTRERRGDHGGEAERRWARGGLRHQGPQTLPPLPLMSLLRRVSDDPNAPALLPLVAHQLRTLQATRGNQYVQRLASHAIGASRGLVKPENIGCASKKQRGTRDAFEPVSHLRVEETKRLMARRLAHAKPLLEGSVREWSPLRPIRRRAPIQTAYIQRSGKPNPLALAAKGIKNGLKLISEGNSKKGSTLLLQGINALGKAAKSAGTPKEKKPLILSAQKGLRAFYHTARLSGTKGPPNLRKQFEKPSVLGGAEMKKGKYAEAAGTYKDLVANLCEIFPEFTDWDGFELLVSFQELMEKRLTFTAGMGATEKGSKSYPPGPGEVEKYFARLLGAPNDKVAKSYHDYCDAFFVHGGTTRLNYNPKSMEVTQVYRGRQTALGSTMTDCDGYARLGARLLGKAGAGFERIIMGIRDHKNQAGEYDDVHAVAQLTRQSKSLFVSNDEVDASEAAAFAGIAWQKPDKRLVKGYGRTFEEANNDAIGKLQSAE